MQMRTSGASRTSAESDRLPLIHIVAFLNQEFRQMQIERQQSLAMVDHHAIPFKEQRPRQDNASAVDGCDRGSAGHAEIEPLMRALYRTVEDALDSENVRDRGIHRSCERTFPFAAGTDSFKNLGFGFLVLLDLALLFGAGRGIASGNLQQHAGITLAFHANLLFK